MKNLFKIKISVWKTLKKINEIIINLFYLDVLCYYIKDDRPSQTAN
jgi:hypothetical protein